MTDELINELVTLAGNLAAEVAGVPIEMVTDSLARFRASLQSELADAIGTDAAEQVGKEFMVTVLKCKAEIESATRRETVH